MFNDRLILPNLLQEHTWNNEIVYFVTFLGKLNMQKFQINNKQL